MADRLDTPLEAKRRWRPRVDPEFFGRIQFRSWDCQPVGDLLTPKSRTPE